MTKVDIIIALLHELDARASAEMLALQIACFPAVTEQEIEEDFSRPCAAHVLAYDAAGAMAGCVELFMRDIVYQGVPVKLGGFSPCVRQDARRQGLGRQLSLTAMSWLAGQGCGLAFLSVDVSTTTPRFYESLGFVLLGMPFLYANSRGEIKEEEGGMIAPLGSSPAFALVSKGVEPLALLPEPGYW